MICPGSISSASGSMRPIGSAWLPSRRRDGRHTSSESILRAAGIAVRAGSFCAHPLVAHLLGVEPAHTLRLLHAIECGEDVLIPGAVRASIGLGTTEAHIDALLDALGEALAGTPA